jgi:hypothetical protein
VEEGVAEEGEEEEAEAEEAEEEEAEEEEAVAFLVALFCTPLIHAALRLRCAPGTATGVSTGASTGASGIVANPVMVVMSTVIMGITVALTECS